LVEQPPALFIRHILPQPAIAKMPRWPIPFELTGTDENDKKLVDERIEVV
jgi:hypothetical protein